MPFQFEAIPKLTLTNPQLTPKLRLYTLHSEGAMEARKRAVGASATEVSTTASLSQDKQPQHNKPHHATTTTTTTITLSLPRLTVVGAVLLSVFVGLLC